MNSHYIVSPVSLIRVTSLTPFLSLSTAHKICFSGCENENKCSCPCEFIIQCNGNELARLNSNNTCFIHRHIKEGTKYTYSVLIRDSNNQLSPRVDSDTLIVYGGKTDQRSVQHFTALFFFSISLLLIILLLVLIQWKRINNVQTDIKQFSPIEKIFFFGTVDESITTSNSIEMKDTSNDNSSDEVIFDNKQDSSIDDIEGAKRRMYLKEFTSNDIKLLLEKGVYSMDDLPSYVLDFINNNPNEFHLTSMEAKENNVSLESSLQQSCNNNNSKSNSIIDDFSFASSDIVFLSSDSEEDTNSQNSQNSENNDSNSSDI